ncbi:MAG: 2-oxo acid dehydrogenase subunit E2 [Spirochaetes bacterium]|nr:2-oxo acid dehydrogenase subunit E2 [Spirochaetota bacterium]
MAKEVLLPKQGNTVESCIILEWKKKEGDSVAAGEVICDVETDKATFQIEAPEAGTLLKIFFPAGEDVPVMTVIAAVGKPGEDVSAMTPSSAVKSETPAAPATASPAPAVSTDAVSASPAAPVAVSGEHVGVSPRARNLANDKGVDASSLPGSGPGGRVIERDVRNAIANGISPAAAAHARESGLSIPASGSGIGGRILAVDLTAKKARVDAKALPFPGASTDIPVKGIRKVISQRMLASLTTTAQLTLSSSADASVMMNYRERIKKTDDALGLNKITLNDFVLYTVSRTLPQFKYMNAHFLGDVMREFDAVHIGFAVDTPKGLMVPVIRNAQAMSLRQISAEAKRLGKACVDGVAKPDELSGATFTISNLGALGIESFTPVLNPPEVAILGVCAVSLRPVMKDGATAFVPHMGLSLTYNHQPVDGAPAARFLKAISDNLANFDVLMMLEA